MTEAKYVYGQNVDDAERERLSHLEAFFDTYTVGRLDQIGMTSGWRCLELGAGQGSVARMLARRVGPSGAVVATDIDLRFLTGLPSNVEVRRHDIETSDLGQMLYDFVQRCAALVCPREPRSAAPRRFPAHPPGAWPRGAARVWVLCPLAAPAY